MAKQKGDKNDSQGTPGGVKASDQRKRSRPHHSSRELRSFYEAALSEAEQALLPEALEVEGLDEEIALLRMNLRQSLEEEPKNRELLLKSIRLLVTAVATKYRLPKADEDNLYESIQQVLRDIGGALYPEILGEEKKG